MLTKKLLRIAAVQSRNVSYWKMRNWYAGLVTPKPDVPPYRHVIQIGDPRLRARCEQIPPNEATSPEIRALVRHMRHVMKRYNCVGLSAPQIGVAANVFVMEFNETHAKRFTADEFNVKEMSLVPFTVVVNPEVKITNYAKIVHPESCESVKGFWADVPRYAGVELSGYDENGEKIIVNAGGWAARIIQHELDHLGGKLYTDSMDRKSLTCACWEAVNERRGKVILPYGPD